VTRILLAFICLAADTQPSHAQAVGAQAAELDLFPNHHTIGVNVKLNVPDPQQDVGATVEYSESPEQTSEDPKFKTGFPLSRVDNQYQRLSGALLWCKPGKSYRVKVTLHDKTTKALDGLVLQGTATARIDPQFLSKGKVLYVAPQGKGNRFSKSQPGDLKQALLTVGPGQRVVLLGGHYHVGNLNLKQSGTATAPIQLEGEANATVVIDGSEPLAAKWKAVGNQGLFSTTTLSANPNLVVADGIRLYPHQSMSDLKGHKISVGLTVQGAVTFAAELDGFYRNPSTNPLFNSDFRSPKKLYVKFRDGSDPAKKKMTITARRSGLSIVGQKHIRIRNIEFAHFGLAPAGTALLLQDCHDVALDHCKFTINDIGLMLAGDCRNVTIQSSEFSDSMRGWYAWKIKATYDNYAPYSSIFPYYARMLERGGILYQHGFRGRGIVVRGCRFHDFAQAGHMGPPSISPNHPGSYEIDFYKNRVWNCTEDGFELDGDARNVRIWHNVFRNCNASISMAVAQAGPTYVIGNVFHDIATDYFTIHPKDGIHTQPGHAFKFQTGDAKSRVGDLIFVHNTIDAPREAVPIDLWAPAQWKRFYARNNMIVANAGPALVVSSAKPHPVDLDYNLYFVRGKTLASVARNGRRATIRTLKELRAWGWEKHGLTSPPKFVSPKDGDYGLQKNSAGIDRGVVIPGINDGRFFGRAPDLGAIESGK
jgi:hypothetical protein